MAGTHYEIEKVNENSVEVHETYTDIDSNEQYRYVEYALNDNGTLGEELNVIIDWCDNRDEYMQKFMNL